jgi:pyruvate/2-oxoglutarate dehydrogenase complex dihydrolipoamide dehydrogenase (E3) component
MHEWLSGRTYAESAAWAKVVIDKRTDRILGAHLLERAVALTAIGGDIETGRVAP